jgi:hypothetical protein
MLEEASAQVAQQAEALDKLGSDADSRAAELEKAQAQLSTTLASLDTSKVNLDESTELIGSLKVENTGALRFAKGREGGCRCVEVEKGGWGMGARVCRCSSVLHWPAWTPQRSIWMSQLSSPAPSRWRTQVG